MGFTITDSNGSEIQQVYSCTECMWASTRDHCRSTEDGPTCILCGASCEKV